MSGRVILVVDDSPTMRRLIVVALSRMPAVSFLEADNGATALRLVAETRVDLVLLDVNMPVLGGFGFLEQLATLPSASRPPVVVITTEGARSDLERARRLGAAGYVTKPIQAAGLLGVVRTHLDRPVAQHASPS
jgi:two-component system chemotaxis response regulator CheY